MDQIIKQRKIISYYQFDVFPGYGGYVGVMTLGYDFSDHLIPKSAESPRSMSLQMQYDFAPKKWFTFHKKTKKNASASLVRNDTVRNNWPKFV